jgi:hypothetical protein
MSIRLQTRPSTDGLGVKRWTYRLNYFVTLHVFERPECYLNKGDAIYLLRVDHADGRTLETRFAKWKSQAIDKAQWIEERVHGGELK